MVVVCCCQWLSTAVVVIVVGVVCFVFVADVRLVFVVCPCVRSRRCVLLGCCLLSLFISFFVVDLRRWLSGVWCCV